MLPEIVRLKQVRLERDLTYDVLGRACGLRDGAVVHKLLHGVTQPTERTLFKIRQYLDAPDKARREARAEAAVEARREARAMARTEATDAA